MSRPGLKIALAASLVLAHSAVPGMAGEKYEGRSYQERLVKSRAERGYTNHGTVIYNYQEVDEYSDDLDDETIGVIDPESRVREIHNYVIIRSGVESEKEHLEIGTVTGESGRGLRVDNSVTIEGDVRGRGDQVNVGTVRTRSAPGEITNEVDIHGDIDN